MSDCVIVPMIPVAGIGNNAKARQKVYDRSICFTCFRDYVDALQGIEQTAGAETAFSAFKILADYCLYGIDPDPANNPWGWAWCLVEQKARNSENNRRRGFGAENVELTQAIQHYYIEHPDATQRAIAEAVGCSHGKVNKVVRSLRESANAKPEMTREERLRRQAEGIALAKAQDKCKGRKPIGVDPERLKAVCERWRAGQMTDRAAMKELGLNSNTFYRRVKEAGL